MSRFSALTAVGVLVCLSACGGGSPQSSVPATVSSSTASGSAVLAFPAATTQATQRAAAFVSPSAASVGIAVNGGTAAFSDVSSTSALCTTTSTGRSCTVPFTAAAGNDSIAFTLYSGASGTGNVLGTGTATAAVTGGQAFTVSVAVGGVPAKIVVSANGSFTQGTASSLPITVTVQDGSGNTIIGSVPYSTPIALTDSDTSGATTLSTASVTSPATAVVLAYNGAAVSGGSVTISASASGVAASAITPATIVVASNTACALHTQAAPHLYVANDAGANTLQFAAPFSATSPGTPLNSESNPVAVKAAYNGTLFVAPFGSSSASSTAGDILEFQAPYTTPVATIGAGLFAGPRGIALDGNLDLFVTDSGHSRILEFVPPYTAAPAALANGVVLPYAIALSPNCNLFVTTNGTVAEYAPPYTGAPIATITANLTNPLGLAFDQAGNLFVSDPTRNVVNEYAAPYTAAPVQQIALATGATAFGIALDSANNLYVSEYGLNAIAVYVAPYTGAPAVTISGAASGLLLPADIAVGP